MRLLRYAVLMAFALAIPASLSAQYPTQTLKHTGGGEASGNVLVGPYNGILGGVAMDIFCIDGAHLVRSGEYSVYVTPLSSVNIGDPTYTYYGMPAYAKAAWLSTRFAMYPDDWDDIHQAIWNITSGGLPATYYTSADNARYWEGKAADFYGGINTREWAVLHAVDGDAQEFLVRRSVPEPEAILLLLSGLVGIAGVVVRRRVL